MSELFADVAVRAALFHQPNAVFTYHVPPALRSTIVEGAPVWVPFGRQRVQGLIVALYTTLPPHIRATPDSSNGPRVNGTADPDSPTIRPIAEVDPEIRIPAHLVRLARWLHGYYRAPLWDALELLLPPGSGRESLTTWRVTALGLDAELGALPPAERGVLYYLRRNGETNEKVLHDALHGSPSELRRVCAALQERGLLARGIAVSKPKVRAKHERLARLLVPPAELPAAFADLQRAPRRAAALRLIAERVAALHGDESDDARVVAQDVPLMTLRELEARKLIELGSREMIRNPLDGAAIQRDIPPELSPLQARVLSPITDAVMAEQHAVFLLHGVTGSGKTELYLRAIARALRKNRQALVLVPEIALTAQLVRRFAARFGEQVVVLHSGLSLGERYDTWRRLQRGDAKVVVGSRSAVFAPLPDLGLIVVDEEHEPTYKHEEGVRYHARDVALELAALTQSVVVLGSATPSIESYQRARDGAYTLLELPERVAHKKRGGLIGTPIPMPPVRIVDMRIELQQGNRSIFSRALQHALDQVLNKQQQALLFLNRRGTAAFVMCRDCGHVVGCPRCSAPLTVHVVGEEGAHGERRQGYELMRCHTCGHRELPPSVCPNCWSARIRHFGVGTQRVVAEVESLFPQARVLRWDRDVTGRKGAHDRLLQTFLNHEADVVVGTQMIAKGLDLPLVTLVGVVSADTGLHMPDFRAGERAFQLMAQVAGRAGRRDLGGEVIIQSYTPEHYALQAAAEHDYRGFFREEIAFRAETHYPPFSQLVRFVTSGTNAESVRTAAESLAVRVHAALERLNVSNTAVIGPAPAFMERMRGRYRWHILVRAPDVHPLLDELGPLSGWTVDVDPASML